MITFEEALDSTKNFISKMKGLDIELNGRPLLDYLDFTILKKEETSGQFILFVNFISGIYNPNRVNFRVNVNKENGNVEDIERINEE
jgi:hypothetical protein